MTGGLTHGEEDTGRQYLLLEGTDAKIHFIYHTPEVAAAWAAGKMRPNSFVRFRRLFGDAGQPFVDAVDLGDAERLLQKKAHFRAAVRAAKKHEEPQHEQAWSGWLGKYLAETEQARTEVTQRQRRSRSDHGR